jgi:hypothetical protein
MTLFAKSLNVDLVARIWDVYMIDGIKAIYQAAIGISIITYSNIITFRKAILQHGV